MKIWRSFPGFSVGMVFLSVTLAVAGPPDEFGTQLNRVINRLNHEAQADADRPLLLSEMIQREYGTGTSDLKWALDHSVSWGEIAAFAYIRATTGRTFEAISEGNANRDFGAYAENAGMSPQKMARSLENFLRVAEKERNSRIFERLRASRTIQAMPDLGSGFGMYQEGLDFRRLDPPQVLKIHTLAPINAREDQ
jgi:hypothetical protein